MQHTRFAICLLLAGCGGKAEDGEAARHASCVKHCELFRDGSIGLECYESSASCPEDCNGDWLRNYPCTPEHEAELSCLVAAGAEFYCEESEGESRLDIDRSPPECVAEVETKRVCVCQEFGFCE